MAESNDFDAEVDALQKIAAALEPLPPRARIRSLWWALAKFCPAVPSQVTDRVLSHGRGLDDEVPHG